jgi:hypothetical protein
MQGLFTGAPAAARMFQRANANCLGETIRSDTMPDKTNPGPDEDTDILRRVSGIKNFFESVLFHDSVEDWSLAKQLGEFLVRTEPVEIMGHALLARAYRHLGEPDRAKEELQRCKDAIAQRPTPANTQLFAKLIIEETDLLSQ